jgi:hypothetical protein
MFFSVFKKPFIVLLGGKRGHKGGKRHFSDPRELQQAKDKELKEKAWRRARGEESSTDDEAEDKEKGSDDSGSESEDSSGSEDGVAFKKDEKDKKVDKKEEEESSEEESSSEDEDRKPKGAEALIAIENPNRVQKKEKKVTQIDTSADGATAKPQLSRREREEIDKQKAKVHYQKLHAAGKTDEARSDLARLAIVRKQREDAAKKRDEEKQGELL